MMVPGKNYAVPPTHSSPFCVLTLEGQKLQLALNCEGEEAQALELKTLPCPSLCRHWLLAQSGQSQAGLGWNLFFIKKIILFYLCIWAILMISSPTIKNLKIQ